MGRMTDARKKARRESGAEPKSEAPPRAEAPQPPAEPAPVAEAAGEAVEFVFPSEPAPREASRERLVLPSSGLAEDILRNMEDQVDAALEPLPAAEPDRPQAPTKSHSHSFFSAPARAEHETVEATEHLVTFLLAEEEYGVDVKLVQEIIRISTITPVPRAPEFIKGVINLRGRIVPVVDLRRKLGLGDVDESGKAARVVVVRLRDRLIGVLVDGASQVLKVPVSTIEAAPEEVLSISHSFIRGVAKLEKRLIILIALQEILVPELREALGVSA